MVGIGIRAPEQTTIEVSDKIRRADKVYSLVADPLAEYWIRTLNTETESLGYLYAEGKERRETYREMVERIVGSVLQNLGVCAVAYGHPGVASYPLHESVRRVRAEGLPAQMVAGISAEDCLFADLGVDPIKSGCLSYEATDFLIHRRVIDVTSNLILWQIGVIAESGFKPGYDLWNRDGLAVLAQRLLEEYRPDHEVVIYSAAQLPMCSATITRIRLQQLPFAPVTILSTLYVPPMESPKIDHAMLHRLGIPPELLDSRAGSPGG